MKGVCIPEGGGGGVLGLIFAGCVPLASQSPYPTINLTIVYFVCPIMDPILVIFGQICNFRDPSLVTFYFYELNHFRSPSFFRLNEEHFTFHLQNKQSGMYVC